jgi:hypothetical protein
MFTLVEQMIFLHKKFQLGPHTSQADGLQRQIEATERKTDLIR